MKTMKIEVIEGGFTLCELSQYGSEQNKQICTGFAPILKALLPTGEGRLKALATMQHQLCFLISDEMAKAEAAAKNNQPEAPASDKL